MKLWWYNNPPNYGDILTPYIMAHYGFRFDYSERNKSDALCVGSIARCTTREAWGDQGFLMPLIGKRARWGANVRSYKVHCRNGVPRGTDVVCFHGKPRPWDIPPLAMVE